MPTKNTLLFGWVLFLMAAVEWWHERRRDQRDHQINQLTARPW